MKRILKVSHAVGVGVFLTVLIYEGIGQNRETFQLSEGMGGALYAGTPLKNKQQKIVSAIFTGNFCEPEGGEGGVMMLDQKGETVTGTLTMDGMTIAVKGIATGSTLTGTLTVNGEMTPFHATIDDARVIFTLMLDDETVTFIRKPIPEKAANPGTETSIKPPVLAKRALRFNKEPLDAKGLATIETLERQWGIRLPDGDYWYDPVCGCAGQWGGPTAGILPPGLKLGGQLRANCSGGGTKVFLNGREIHPDEYRYLSQLVGAMILPGRYWIDAWGNTGLKGLPPLTNLFVLAQQRANSGKEGGSWMHSTSNGHGGNNYIGGDSSFLYFQGSDGSSFYIDR